MARIPRSFARRARSTAWSFLGTPSGSECACISIAPLTVCAFADSEKTRNIAASCDLMAVPFIEQVSLELGADLTRRSHWLPRQCANYPTAHLSYRTSRCHATSECEHDGNGGPCVVVVSAPGSLSDQNSAAVSVTRRKIVSRSSVERASRSNSRAAFRVEK